MAESLPNQGQTDVLPVLVTIADNHRSGLLGHCQHRHQFRLAACFEAYLPFRGSGLGGQQFLDHAALLVDLDRVDRCVTALVGMFFCDLVEGIAQFVDAVVQDINEAHQHRQLNPGVGQCSGQLRQVDPCRALAPIRTNQYLSLVVDTYVAIAPVGNVVNLVGRGGAGFAHACYPVRKHWPAGNCSAAGFWPTLYGFPPRAKRTGQGKYLAGCRDYRFSSR